MAADGQIIIRDTVFISTGSTVPQQSGRRSLTSIDTPFVAPYSGILHIYDAQYPPNIYKRSANPPSPPPQLPDSSSLIVELADSTYEFLVSSYFGSGQSVEEDWEVCGSAISDLPLWYYESATGWAVGPVHAGDTVRFTLYGEYVNPVEEIYGPFGDSVYLAILDTPRPPGCDEPNDGPEWCQFYVKIFTTVLDVTVDTTEIRPRRTDGVDTTTVTVRVTAGDLPLSGVAVHLAARGVDSSGGHYHTVGRPAGVFGNSNGTTDSNGVYKTTFYANWFGGEEWIIASSSLIPQRDSVLMTIRVPGLELLPAGAHYVKIGGTCSHHGPRDDNQHQSCRTPDNNHNAAQIVRDFLPLMAMVWVDSLGQDTLFINDISLPNGGLFDHKAITSPWTAPHATHRIGLDVDVRTELGNRRGVKVRNAQGQTVGNKEFVRLAKRFGVERLEPHDPRTDNEHYHLYYRSP